VVIPHAVDAAFFPYRPQPLRSLDGVQLVVVSHAAPHKGMDTAVALLGELHRRGCNPTLSFTMPRHGHPGIFGVYVEHCATLADDLGVADRVRYLGRQADVRSLYETADVIVVPSLTESFGFPLLEAMASGTPLLASRIPSSVEVAGDVAWFFDAGAPMSAAQALTAMVADPKAAARRLDEGRRRAEASSWAVNAASVGQLLRQVSGARDHR
jgi:glycosyltransferase involved in cell wall biosynthesis